MHDLDTATKNTWDCKFCEQRKLMQARNCKGRYGKTAIVLSPEIMYTECPIGKLFDLGCREIYKLLKSSLLAEFKGYTPSQLLEELNIFFVYADVIRQAEADYSQTKEKNNGR